MTYAPPHSRASLGCVQFVAVRLQPIAAPARGTGPCLLFGRPCSPPRSALHERVDELFDLEGDRAPEVDMPEVHWPHVAQPVVRDRVLLGTPAVDLLLHFH